MKRARVGIIAAAVFAVASVAFAQEKPDFSGTWTLDTSAAPAGGGGGGRGGGMGGPMVVKQTADTLTIERTRGENKTTTAYKLDGTESTNTMTMGREGASVETKSVAKWDGGKLTISTKRPGQDGAMMETTETWSLDAGTLTIERTGGRGAAKQVYKKTT
jgi:hypothetical protein